jgi:hypothetical protein
MNFLQILYFEIYNGAEDKLLVRSVISVDGFGAEDHWKSIFELSHHNAHMGSYAGLEAKLVRKSPQRQKTS